ncbi:MAG: hypothetical protein JNN00_17680 [Chitinophagaceae bacterium]|nr:hypothetical protein [Chitinophagaceae bacterium]
MDYRQHLIELSQDVLKKEIAYNNASKELSSDTLNVAMFIDKTQIDNFGKRKRELQVAKNKFNETYNYTKSNYPSALEGLEIDLSPLS